MQTLTLHDGSESFHVSVREASGLSPVVLFAAGASGHPERHVTLLDALAETGCTVIAPHFQRLSALEPADAELACRARRMCLALDTLAPTVESVVGVGHSIGAALLLALAGGHMWSRRGQRVDIRTDGRLTRLGLMAPPTGFFHAPGALDAVRARIQIWVGSADTITPPGQSEWLARGLRGRQSVDVRTMDGAGHFSFMDQPPPGTVEPLQDQQSFLREYSNEMCRFVCG